MLEPATEEFNQKVCQKFNTSLQQVQKDVEVLKEWIRQQPHLPQCSSDTLLTTFLIACKNSMERAKEKIDNYYTARSTITDFFGDRDLEDKRGRIAAQEIKLFFLPKMTPEGYRVRMALFQTGDFEKWDIQAACKRIMAFEDMKLHLEPFCMGEYLILDGKRFTSYHLVRITPALAKDFFYCLQDAMPIPIKGVFLINAPTYVELALNIARPFLKKKLLQRIHIHTEGPEVLDRYFPRKLLPSDYGGEEETSERLHEQWNQLLREKRDWLMGEGSATVDEKKRIKGSRKNVLREMQGSFRTLSVD